MICIQFSTAAGGHSVPVMWRCSESRIKRQRQIFVPNRGSARRPRKRGSRSTRHGDAPVQNYRASLSSPLLSPPPPPPPLLSLLITGITAEEQECRGRSPALGGTRRPFQRSTSRSCFDFRPVPRQVTSYTRPPSALQRPVSESISKRTIQDLCVLGVSTAALGEHAKCEAATVYRSPEPKSRVGRLTWWAPLEHRRTTWSG